jgi:glycosyltransferase involved in cell wall biosynthesis
MSVPSLTRPDAGLAARHVCVVTETYAPEINGVATTLAHLVCGLRQRGRRVTLVRPRQGADDRPGEEEVGDVMLVRGVAVSWCGGVRVGLPAGAALRHLWMADRPDAVYVATEGLLGWSAVRVARALGIPALSGFHTNFHGYARHYRAGWFASLVFRHLRRFHNGTLGTLVASPELRDRLSAAGLENLHVLGRGVDAELFTPARRCAALRETWGVPGHGLVALYVGRLAPEKNLALAIQAYRAMRRASPTLRFVLVGDGPLRGTLGRAHPDLYFCGTQIGERLAAHYASADVFLFPSETETFGNVTLEAMASGLVVVAFDDGAARTYIAHGESGVLVARGAYAAFVAAAAGLAAAPSEMAQMRHRARASATRADWASVVDRFDALLASHAAVPRAARLSAGDRARRNSAGVMPEGGRAC